MYRKLYRGTKDEMPISRDLCELRAGSHSEGLYSSLSNNYVIVPKGLTVHDFGTQHG